MDSWEYYTLVIIWNQQEGWKGYGTHGNITGMILSDILNQVGKNGWEIVSLFPTRYARTNAINYTLRNAGGISGDAGSSATEWTASEYRACFKRRKP